MVNQSSIIQMEQLDKLIKGIVFKKETYKNGILNGEVITYTKKGKIKDKVIYINGLLQ